jgi:beta-glucanase (GH16 family)
MKPPTLDGYSLLWSDDFSTSGSPNRSKWTLETPATTNNNEQQIYTSSAENAYAENGTLFIVPVKKDNIWTSARMHNNTAFKCEPNGRMLVVARIKVGQNNQAQQQGIWPAFWTLGNSVNHGVDWYVPLTYGRTDVQAEMLRVGYPGTGQWAELESGHVSL